MRYIISALLAFGALATPRLGHACGASSAGTGVSACNLAELREERRPKWRVGVATSYSRTVISFLPEGLTVPENWEQSRVAVVATGEWRPTPRWSVGLSVGALAFGELTVPEQTIPMGNGPLGSVMAQYVVVAPAGGIPFVILSGQIAGLTTRAASGPRYRALDLRLGVQAGWLIARTVAPYAVARAFGGPIWTRINGANALGTDLYHYQLGAGVSLLLDRVDLYAECIPFGEGGCSAGVGLAF